MTCYDVILFELRIIYAVSPIMALLKDIGYTIYRHVYTLGVGGRLNLLSSNDHAVIT